MIYMILITKLADLLMLDAIFLQSVAFTFSFDLFGQIEYGRHYILPYY